MKHVSTDRPVARCWIRLLAAGAMVCVAVMGASSASAQLVLPQAPVRGLPTPSLSVAANPMLTLSDPRQTLVSTFMQQVTYEVGSVPAALHLEIQGIGNAFDQVQTEITITGFDAAAAVGTPASPGTSTGTHLVVDGNGPVALIGGIVNMRVTANLRITVTLSSRYALSGDRNFVFQYSLL